MNRIALCLLPTLLWTLACDDGASGGADAGQCAGAKCDDVDDAEAAARPAGIWMVLDMNGSGWDPQLSANTLVERVLGKRTWEIQLFVEDRGFDVGPDQHLFFVKLQEGEFKRLDEREPGLDWGARLAFLAQALERDSADVQGVPRVVTVLPEMQDGSNPEPADVQAGVLPIDDPEWYFASAQDGGVGIREAWEMIEAQGRAPGRDADGQPVIVGHPDTGIIINASELGLAKADQQPRTNPEGPVLMEQGINTQKDVVVGPTAAQDTFPSALDFNDNWGHGTRTATLIVSAPGKEDGTLGEGWATGVAPGAKLLPARFHDSVVVRDGLLEILTEWVPGLDAFDEHGTERTLARAIDETVASGARVISMSVGGEVLDDAVLQASIDDAVRAGALLFAAAGNGTGAIVKVTEPGEYDGTIAVAASNFWGGVWSASNFGEHVDIAAPGEDVRHGRPSLVFGPDGYVMDTQAGVGTSLSTAIAAGIGALWWSFHGSQTILDTYCTQDGDCSAVSAAFVHILNTSGHRDYAQGSLPEGRDYGPGIIDAAAILAAGLPEMCEDETARFGWRACDA